MFCYRYEDNSSSKQDGATAQRALLSNSIDSSDEQTIVQQLLTSNKVLPTRQTAKIVKILVSVACK